MNLNHWIRCRWFGLFFFVVAVVGVVFSACSRKKENLNVLKFVTWKPNQPEVWETVYRIFEREHPDIHVMREIGPHSSTAFHDLLTQKLKNKSPDVDVFFMDVVWPSEFAAAGWALPLDEYFPEHARKQFLDATIQANTFQGHVYGVPLFIDSGVLYFRKDLLNEYGFHVPETWLELISQAETIVAAEAERGRVMVGFSGQFKQYEGLVCNMMEFVLGNGGALVDDSTSKSAVAGEAAVEAVRFVRDRLIGNVAPRGVLTYQEPESLDLFIQGKAVFHRNWPYAWEISNNPSKSWVSGKVGIARVPHFPGHRSYATLGGWQLGISQYAAHKEMAWKFIRFLTSERIQRLFAVKSGKAPTRKALYTDVAVLAANPHFRRMKDVFLTAYPRPVTPLYPSLSNILQRYFSMAIVNNRISIGQAAEKASQDMNRVLSMAR